MTPPTPAARRSEYRALAYMYAAQGLPAGLAFNALATLIREGGHDLADVGLTGLAFLPWAFKFLWAGPVDDACARFGHARVIFAFQALAVLACAALVPFAPGAHLGAALAGIVLLNTLCATQDIATNAYAVARLQGSTAGPANAIQIGAFIVGMLAGGGGLLVAHDAFGWSATVALMAALMAALGLALRLDRGWQAGARPAPGRPRARLRDLRSHRDLGWALAVALLFKFAGTAVATLLQPWLVDRGLDLAAIGRLQIAMLLATAVGGAVLGIPLVRRLGNRGAVLAAGSLAALLLGTAWALEAGGVRGLAPIYAALCLQSLFEGAMYVAIWALFMNWASPERPGTEFTVMQCSESLANALAAGAIGGLGQRFGYGAAFALVWAAGAAAMMLIAWSLPRLALFAGIEGKAGADAPAAGEPA